MNKQKQKKNNKSSLKIFNIEDKTLKTVINVLIGSREEICEFFLKRMETLEDYNDITKFIRDKSTNAVFQELDDKKTDQTLFMICVVKDRMDEGIIAHEFNHAIFRTLSYKGIEYSKETEEIFCYSLSFFINEFYKKWRKI
jgi:hypothetical protein